MKLEKLIQFQTDKSSKYFLTMTLSVMGLIATIGITMQTKSKQTSQEKQKTDNMKNRDVEYIFKNTERNKRLLYGANGLLENPWGFENCHFASILAAMRPSPFRFGDDRALIVRRRVSTDDNMSVVLFFSFLNEDVVIICYI